MTNNKVADNAPSAEDIDKQAREDWDELINMAEQACKKCLDELEGLLDPWDAVLFFKAHAKGLKMSREPRQPSNYRPPEHDIKAAVEYNQLPRERGKKKPFIIDFAKRYYNGNEKSARAAINRAQKYVANGRYATATVFKKFLEKLPKD